jgi:hypothetical protein
MSPTKPRRGQIVLSPDVLPAGIVGEAYNQTISASGGREPYKYSFTGSLPPGLSLSTGGIISGTPSYVGVSSFAIAARDRKSATGSQAYTIDVSGAEQPQPEPSFPVSRGHQAKIFERIHHVPIASYGRKYIAAGGGAPGDTTTGLVSNWQFTDGTGLSAIDSGPAANNATIPGANWLTDAAGPCFGFDNTTPHFAHADLIASYQGNTITIFCWINNSTAASNAIIFTHLDYGQVPIQQAWLLATDQASGTHVRWWCCDDGNGASTAHYRELISSYTPFGTGVWTSLAARFNNGAMDIFVNGIKDPSPTVTGSITTLWPATIGLGFATMANNNAWTASGLTFKGKKFRFYNIAKTDADILAIHNLG